MLPSRTSVSYGVGRLIGSRFSKTIVAIRSEKSISIMGFEKGKLLNLRRACHARRLAHNRSISRNARSDTLDPCLKISWLSIVQIQLPSFPFGCYTNPIIHPERTPDGPTTKQNCLALRTSSQSKAAMSSSRAADVIKSRP